jgi:hypothetical protein
MKQALDNQIIFSLECPLMSEPSSQGSKPSSEAALAFANAGNLTAALKTLEQLAKTEWENSAPGDFADAYKIASGELNQRMSARHSTYLGFMVATGAYIYAVMGRYKPGVPLVASGIFLFPAAICFAFSAWIRSQDLTVGLLSSFCRICETRNSDTLHLSFYSEQQGWQKRAMRQREWMEIAFVLIAVILMESPLGLSLNGTPDSGLISIFCSDQLALGVCSWMILSLRHLRYRMFDLRVVPTLWRDPKGKYHFFYSLNCDLANEIKPVRFAAWIAFGFVILSWALSRVVTVGDTAQPTGPYCIVLFVLVVFACLGRGFAAYKEDSYLQRINEVFKDTGRIPPDRRSLSSRVVSKLIPIFVLCLVSGAHSFMGWNLFGLNHHRQGLLAVALIMGFTMAESIFLLIPKRPRGEEMRAFAIDSLRS